MYADPPLLASIERRGRTMIQDDETIGSFQSHENQQCGGLANACTFCHAERARCVVCDRLTGGPTYCERCADKVDQIIASRLYDYAANR